MPMGPLTCSTLPHLSPAGPHPHVQGHLFLPPHFSLSVTSAHAPITNSCGASDCQGGAQTVLLSSAVQDYFVLFR